MPTRLAKPQDNIGLVLSRMLTGKSAPFLAPITRESLRAAKLRSAKRNQLHIMVGRGLVSPTHVSQGVPWEVLGQVTEAMAICRECGVPFDQITVVIGVAIATTNRPLHPNEKRRLREIAAWHLAAMERVNEYCMAIGEQPLRVQLDYELMRSPFWRSALENVRAKTTLAEYAAYQTALVATLYAEIRETRPSALLLKAGATTFSRKRELIESAAPDSLLQDAECLKGTCEAAFDLWVSRVYPRARIGFYYSPFPVGPDGAHKRVSPYVVGDEEGRLFLIRLPDFVDVLHRTYPDPKPLRLSLKSLRAYVDRLAATFTVTKSVEDGLPDLFPERARLSMRYVQHEELVCLMADAKKRAEGLGMEGRRFMATLERHYRLALEGHCEYMAEIIRRRLLTLSQYFGPTPAQIDAQLPRVPQL